MLKKNSISINVNQKNLRMSKPKNYKDICLTIWGCIPIDWKWAIQTQIFKQEQNKP